MRLHKMTLRNFKGIANFTLDTQGNNVSVYADNEGGKTTLADAFHWLLFDKDSQNKKDFSIKTLDSHEEVIPAIDHEVETALDIGGKQTVLRKVYAEKWTKKRGSAKQEFTGHETNYFVDGVPVKKSEYTKYIDSIINEDIFKLLTSPTYFNEQLHWQDRRDIIMEVCGDISDKEVIDSYATLNNKQDVLLLTNIINQRSLEDHKKVIAAERSRINKELDKIPTRIDEVVKGMPEQAHIESKESLQGQIVNKKDEVSKLEQQLSALSNGKAITDKQRQIAEIETELINIKNQYREKTEGKADSKRQELRRVQEEALSVTSNISRMESRVKYLLEDQADNEIRRQSLRDKWYEYNSQQFIFEQSDTCPTCGQSLPESQLQAAREKALGEFNRAKSHNLETISKDGFKLKEKSESMETEISALISQIADARKNQTGLDARIEAMKENIANTDTSEPPVTDRVDYIELETQKAALLDDIKKLKDGNTAETDKIKNEIDWQNEALSSLQIALAQIEYAESGKKRIEELKQQERELAEAFEKLEHELYLTEEFTKAKVRLLEEKINSKFKLARFKMFENQINEGIKETCETTYKGVPYNSGLNLGHRIIVGMDIIRTLSEHYGFYPPIFVDNAESVTTLPEMNTQIIRLIKPEITAENKQKYSKLVVEVEGAQANLFKEAI